jgi:gas vesicle protein
MANVNDCWASAPWTVCALRAKPTLGMGALLIGAGMGAVIAMLYAPQSGSKSRRQLKGKAEELRKEWGGRAEELINSR